MNHDPLDYQILLQEALLGLVRRSLEIVAEQGFSGDHHFYLTFRTEAPGVSIPDHLRDSYPEEMTIVLKTQFKDLLVTEEAFSVGLWFSSVLYYLTVPFAALTSFSDPASGFQLMFQPVNAGELAAEGSEEPAVEPEAGAAGEMPASDNVVSFAGFQKKK